MRTVLKECVRKFMSLLVSPTSPSEEDDYVDERIRRIRNSRRTKLQAIRTLAVEAGQEDIREEAEKKLRSLHALQLEAEAMKLGKRKK